MAGVNDDDDPRSLVVACIATGLAWGDHVEGWAHRRGLGPDPMTWPVEDAGELVDDIAAHPERWTKEPRDG